MPDLQQDGTAINAEEEMDSAAELMKEALTHLSRAMSAAPREVIADLSDANLNAYHALGRTNTARALATRRDIG